MIEAVKKFCRDSKQQVPETVGEIAAVIYNSLAKCYGDTIEEIEALTGKKYTTIYVVGGGANAGYLNELTAKYTGKKFLQGLLKLQQSEILLSRCYMMEYLKTCRKQEHVLENRLM